MLLSEVCYSFIVTFSIILLFYIYYIFLFYYSIRLLIVAAETEAETEPGKALQEMHAQIWLEVLTLMHVLASPRVAGNN